MEYLSQSMLQKRRWSKTAILILVLLVLIDIALAGLLGFKILRRSRVSAAERQDAIALKTTAEKWRSANNGFWPEPCIVDPGVPRLCEKGENRDEIAASIQGQTKTYTVFIIDSEFIEGDITKNDLVTYGVSKNALILVNQSSCFQEKEVSSGSQFSVIYARTTKTGKETACV